MSRRYEFLSPGAEIVSGPDAADEFEEDWDESEGVVALVMGNPWATAAVLSGTRDEIAATLREYLALVERTPE